MLHLQLFWLLHTPTAELVDIILSPRIKGRQLPLVAEAQGLDSQPPEGVSPNRQKAWV